MALGDAFQSIKISCTPVGVAFQSIKISCTPDGPAVNQPPSFGQSTTKFQLIKMSAPLWSGLLFNRLILALRGGRVAFQLIKMDDAWRSAMLFNRLRSRARRSGLRFNRLRSRARRLRIRWAWRAGRFQSIDFVA